MYGYTRPDDVILIQATWAALSGPVLVATDSQYPIEESGLTAEGACWIRLGLPAGLRVLPLVGSQQTLRHHYAEYDSTANVLRVHCWDETGAAANGAFAVACYVLPELAE